MLMPRSHNRLLGNTFDTVASHSFHTAIMAYVLARMEKHSHNQALKALAMGLLHDLAEARTGDKDWITRQYQEVNGEKAIKDQFANLTFGKDLEQLVNEYEARETSLAKVVKDADLVQQMYQEWVLMWQGNKLAEAWWTGKQKFIVPYLRTKSAKQLIESMKDSNPNEWWIKEFQSQEYDASSHPSNK